MAGKKYKKSVAAYEPSKKLTIAEACATVPK